ncbi:MAG: 3-methyl-2-oxobutanoate dehydrogenase subunit beta, partial [Elusimicrobiota bacterium]|nr:3-methyl-2-oxobutanoate dehydrogenase subunit beta [Elusimicrobiota bacterium]
GKEVNNDWSLTGCAGRQARSIKSLLMKEGMLTKHNLDLQAKYKRITENEVKFESFMNQDSEIIITAFGISSRIAKGAVKLARSKGIKAGLFRPKTLFPFPSQAIRELAKPNVKFLSVELNHGQMVEDVSLSINGKCPIEFLGKAGGAMVSETEILEKIIEMSKEDK